MKWKYRILVGIAVLALGIAAFLLRPGGTSPNTSRLPDSGRTGRSTEGYRAGSLEAGGKRHAFKYKRYAKPFKPTKDFRWEEDLTKSPLDTVLTSISKKMRAESVDDYLSAYKDKTLARRRIIGTAMRVGKITEDQWFEWSNKRVRSREVLGEVVYRNVTVIVEKVVTQHSGYVLYTGTCVVKEGDKYLIDLTAKERIPFLRHLSADDYSAITGVKGPE